MLEGEATQEEVLLQAGLTRARGLLTAIGDDVMDPGAIQHMFSQVVSAYIHKLNCIQS